MATAQNIIHSSSFNFEYETKASAKRGNELIESIFDSQILPELEKAVAEKIPSEVRIELSKLEINIGTISEKELPVILAARIRESLENALTFNIGQKLNGKSITPVGQKPGNFLIQSLEIFLLKGYFPFGMERSLTFDELIKRILQQNQAGLFEVLQRHRNREQVIQRMTNNLSTETFDELLTLQEPVNTKWIIEFREFLMKLKKELNLNQYSDSEFLKMMNASILKFTLNETSLTFSKEKFSTNIIRWFMDVLDPDINLIAEVIQRNKGTDPVLKMAESSLKQLQVEKSKIPTTTKSKPLSIEQLVELLNAGGEDLHSLNLELLKEEIFLAIRSSEKREQLVAQLTESGASFLVGLFSPESDDSLYKLIRAFTQNIAAQFHAKFSGEIEKQLNHFVTEAILYWHENSARKLDNEEFVLLLISSAGLDVSEIGRSSEFQKFIHSEKSIRPKKMLQVVEDEKHFAEISVIHQVISKSEVPVKQDSLLVNPDSFTDNELSKVYKKKIVLYYLANGRLPEPFSRFNLREVQQIFLELIQQRDDFLAIKIKKAEDPKILIVRLKSLIPIIPPDDLEAYFIHFFQEEFGGLSKIMDELSQQFALGEKVGLNEKSIKNEIFMQALAESGGENLHTVFRSVALEFLIAELAKEFRIPENLPKLFEVEPDKNRIKNALEKDLVLLVNQVRFAKTGVRFSGNAVEEIVKKIAFYAHLNQQLFLESIQKYTSDQELVFTLLKFYLPEKQWKSVSKTLSPLTGFEKFQQKTDSSDYFFEQYRTALRSFSPGTFSGKLNSEFWRSVVEEFAIQAFVQEKKLTSATFAKTFFSHLLQKLKAVHKPELFYPVIEKMLDSGSNELIELVELWKAPDKSEPVVNVKNEPEKQNQVKALEHQLGILKFYAQHDFLPWWAGQLTFPEVINNLQKLAGKIPGEFEESLLLAEKESQIFEKLANRIPASACFEIDRLIAGSRELKVKWEEVLQIKKNKSKIQDESGRVSEKTEGQSDISDIDDFLEKAAKNTELLYKGLYFLTDDQILNQWLKESHEIAEQIQSYLKLGPYFYFRNITPGQWREAVYAFSLDFYKENLKRSQNQFHTEFLKFIKRQYPRVNWNEVLKSVYFTVHQPELKQKVVFPAALARLLNLKSGLPDHIKELNKKMETIFSDEDSGVGVKVYNAGLILFWPFLTRLFEHLSFVKNGEFVNSEFKNRAVYLLQYLVFNETDFPEYELVLNKILAGMLPEDHLDPFVTLTEEEKELANSLLHGLINNWEKVKSSTPEGIQETFLQREGILRFKNGEVYLDVEKKGVDILVKSIPWNISLIKLPWMKKTMHVEWV